MPPGHLRGGVHERVETVVVVDGRRVHRFQVVRERREGDGVEDWVVVGFDGAEGVIHLADPDFEWTRDVSADEVASGRFEPLVEGGVPVWGY